MARGYRSRRFRSARRIGRRYKSRKSSLARIKKDIMKCNFPTKVKFMGLTEKKVMFLTKTLYVTMNKPAAQNDPATGPTRSFYLCPLNSDNIETILGQANIPGANAQANLSNWDKFCILGIYIKFQPVINMFDGGNDARAIHPVTATYTMNNVTYGVSAAYDQVNKKNKQVFTFNSNEAFTIYIPAPTTMETQSAVVHKSKTWWSITDLAPFGQNIQDVLETGEDGSSEEEDPQEVGDPFNPGNLMHAGRISLSTNSAARRVYYNVTINYKVALKG